MAQWPHDDTASLTAFYGRPGTPSNLVLVSPPWQMTYEGRPVRGAQVHHLLAASLRAVFEDIAAQVGRDWTRLPPGAVKFSGSYNYRSVRGSSRVSCHGFGAAIDMDAAGNGMNTRGDRGSMSHMVIDAFKRQGWYWGGDFQHRQDPMHFQAANEGQRTYAEAMADDEEVFSAEDVVFGEIDQIPTQLATIDGQPSPPVSSTAPSGTPVAPQAPSMGTSKTGWAAVGLGGSGALDGLRQANEYASEISMAKWNLQQLDLPTIGNWLWAHPAIFVPFAVVGAAVYVWHDHRKYKRLLAAAQQGK